MINPFITHTKPGKTKKTSLDICTLSTALRNVPEQKIGPIGALQT